METLTNQNIGWQITNGSGWNHHKTADALKEIENLPEVPLGYGVLVAPISDKPFGLRCALVRALPRRFSPFISIHTPGGNFVSHPDSVKYDHIRLAEITDVQSARDLLSANGYVPTAERPSGWGVGAGREWFRAQDGTWASIELLDDGCEGDPNGWVRDVFDIDAEIVKSVKCEQQSDDDSGYFMRTMAEAIKALEPIPGSPETQFDGVDRRDAPFYKKIAAGKPGAPAKAAGISREKAREILNDEASL